MQRPYAWDEALFTFFSRVGLTQTTCGFQSDLLMLNSEYEQNELPRALEELYLSLGVLTLSTLTPEKSLTILYFQAMLHRPSMDISKPTLVPPLDVRRLHHVPFTKDVEKQTPKEVQTPH